MPDAAASGVHVYDVVETRPVFTGRVTAMRSDQVRMPGGSVSQRDVVMLPGAIAIVALDSSNRILLVRQYRHPVRRHLWEVPAGLLDSTTETATEAGERELFEEGHLRAATWHTLVDVLTSPGMADETVRCLLARDLTEVPEAERFAGFHEEADMTLEWRPLDLAVDQVLSGEIENGITVAAVLALAAARMRGLDSLRAADAPWRARKS